jgi:hypothetical protein
MAALQPPVGGRKALFALRLGAEAIMTMRAAVVPELGGKLESRELPVLEPGPGKVLIRMQASGLCHRDIHAAPA